MEFKRYLLDLGELIPFIGQLCGDQLQNFKKNMCTCFATIIGMHAKRLVGGLPNKTFKDVVYAYLCLFAFLLRVG